jgi:hypothetical protein
LFIPVASGPVIDPPVADLLKVCRYLHFIGGWRARLKPIRKKT